MQTFIEALVKQQITSKYKTQPEMVEYIMHCIANAEADYAKVDHVCLEEAVGDEKILSHSILLSLFIFGAPLV